MRTRMVVMAMVIHSAYTGPRPRYLWCSSGSVLPTCNYTQIYMYAQADTGTVHRNVTASRLPAGGVAPALKTAQQRMATAAARSPRVDSSAPRMAASSKKPISRNSAIAVSSRSGLGAS